MKQWDRKILAVHMQWDYCDPARGPSPEKAWFYENLRRLAPASDVFYYDEFIHDLALLRRKLLEKAEAFSPDLIFFVPYTDQFSCETLDELKARWPTCAWFGDDTWRFDSFSSRLAPHVTYPLTTDPLSVEKYRKLGVEPIVTQWAGHRFGPELAPLPPAGKFRYDVSFIGGRDYTRDWFVWELGRRGIPVECFGSGWPNGRVSAEEMERIFNGSRINLNLSNTCTGNIRCLLHSPLNALRYLRSRKTAEQIKARNFEIPLAGGFQLTNSVAGLERYLDIGREVAVFTSLENCAQEIRRYLSDEPARCLIAAAGWERARREHTYLNRLESIFGEIWP